MELIRRAPIHRYTIVKRYVSRRDERVKEAFTGIRGTREEAFMTFNGYVRVGEHRPNIISLTLHHGGASGETLDTWYPHSNERAA